MADVLPDDSFRWRSELRRDGYCFVAGAAMRAALADVGDLHDWDAFAASWNELEVDSWMADRAAYRRRRHAVFELNADGMRAQPQQPHYQSIDYNPLHGGVQRWFQPLAPAQLHSASLRSILQACTRWFPLAERGDCAWKVEVHQFRIEASAGQAGQPTPEGMHRDGVDWVLVLMIGRRNIAAGTTSIHNLDGELMGSFTLQVPFDAALVDDHRCFHGVTPVIPADPAAAGSRDVLVVTLKQVGA